MGRREMTVTTVLNTQNIWKRNLPVLWLGVFLCSSSYTMCIPFLPLYLLRELNVAEGSINFWTGMTFAVTFMLSAIMAPYWGALADHVGQRKMAARAGFGLALTYFLAGVCEDVYQLLAVRALCGFIAGFVPACMSMASASLPESRMGWGMGLMQTAAASGTIMGPLMGGYLSSWFGMRASFYMGSAALFIATFAVVFIAKDMTVRTKGDNKPAHLIGDLWHALHNAGLRYVMLMFFIVQSCNMLIQPLITLYVGHLMGTIDNSVIKMAGFIFSLGGITGIIAAPFWGKRGQRFGYIRTFALVTFTAGFINLFQVFITNIWQFAGIQFVFGLFLAGAFPNINADLTKVTSREMRGKAFGLVTSAQQGGGVAGPVLGGILGSYLPAKYVLVIVGCILISIAAYSFFTKVRGRPLHAAD